MAYRYNAQVLRSTSVQKLSVTIVSLSLNPLQNHVRRALPVTLPSPACDPLLLVISSAPHLPTPTCTHIPLFPSSTTTQASTIVLCLRRHLICSLREFPCRHASVLSDLLDFVCAQRYQRPSPIVLCPRRHPICSFCVSRVGAYLFLLTRSTFFVYDATNGHRQSSCVKNCIKKGRRGRCVKMQEKGAEVEVKNVGPGIECNARRDAADLKKKALM